MSRLTFDSFPKNHNLILSGQLQIIDKMALKVNEDIRSRITYSVILKKLPPDDMEKFIYDQLDAVGLGHNAFTEEAIALIIRTADGIIRRTRNLCISALLEAVRDRKRTIDIDIISRILIQPHCHFVLLHKEVWRFAPTITPYLSPLGTCAVEKRQ